MKSYDEMDEIEYAEAVTEYADLLASLADGWTENDVWEDLMQVRVDGDGFIETMTDDQLWSFAQAVARKMEETK